MVGVAQLVRVSGCGPEGHGFKSHRPPEIFFAGPIVQWPRTPPFHGGNTGSNPVRVTYNKSRFYSGFFIFS